MKQEGSVVLLIFPVCMFLLFMTLKLTGVIGWSYWLVTLPLWLFPALFVVVCIFTFVIIPLIILVVLILFMIVERIFSC